MLSDPFVLGAESLPRISEGSGTAVYSFSRADGFSKIVVTVRHSTEGGKNGSQKYDRSNIEVRETVFATALAGEYENLDYFVARRKPGLVGVVNADNLADYMIAGTNANLIRILKGES
jgi:hypothetical protein